MRLGGNFKESLENRQQNANPQKFAFKLNSNTLNKDKKDPAETQRILESL